MSHPNPRYVLLKKHAENTGYSLKALNQKIDKGTWIQGIHWRKSPDGKRQINLEEYEKWVEGRPAAFSAKAKSSDANSCGRASE
ncbi:MAG: excisionase [Hydrogenophaga sp.]|uniref:excisionase n=1 Tax=Hydrogenophaga sp. TaxID=1904254 RepID=UPI002AB87861|nr:excisionase [Hydrogenophaga sp.]MDZ4282841.1 excisionase [Hydrogenophaga sp.]